MLISISKAIDMFRKCPHLEVVPDTIWNEGWQVCKHPDNPEGPCTPEACPLGKQTPEDE